MRLLNAKVGDIYKVKSIKLELDVKRRLQMLGLTMGTGIEVLNRKRNGSIIFKVRGTRFAVGKKIANGIIVEGDII